jgi:hypothetical protein
MNAGDARSAGGDTSGRVGGRRAKRTLPGFPSQSTSSANALLRSSHHGRQIDLCVGGLGLGGSCGGVCPAGTGGGGGTTSGRIFDAGARTPP